ncbi:MAG: DUF5995 family protein [Bacteroidota bacterium]
MEAPQIRPQVQTIQEVIDQLGTIIDWAYQEKSTVAFFPCLYRRVTIQIAEGIKAGAFEDNPRMERLDVAFANRYFEAFSQYDASLPTTSAWRVAFEAHGHSRPLIIQHLILGINAHINLDLGIAAANMLPGPQIMDLEQDFITINEILEKMTHEIQRDVNRLSPAFRILDGLAGKKDEYLAFFCLKSAREYAWAIAKRFAYLTEEERAIAFPKVDQKAAEIGEMVLRPPSIVFRVGISLIKLLERRKISRIIEKLR